MPIVHAVSQTIFECFAVSADALACPFAIAEGLKFRTPHFPQVVGIDIALGKTFAVDVWTGADGSVDKDRSNVYTRMAEVWCLSHLALVWSKITFATESDVQLRI